MTSTARVCSILFAGFLSQSAFAQTSLDNWTLSIAGLTRHYSYENDEAREALSNDILQYADDADFTGDEDDIVNFNFGIGYYITDAWHLGVNYNEGIEIGFLDDLDNILVSGFDGIEGFNSFDTDMKIITLESRHNIVDLSDNLNLFVNGGLTMNRISARVERVEDSGRSLLAKETNTEYGVNAGVGLIWNFAGGFSAIARYNHYTFMSIDEVSVTFEYRF